MHMCPWLTGMQTKVLESLLEVRNITLRPREAQNLLFEYADHILELL